MKILPLITLIVLIACNRVDTSKSITGKWYGISDYDYVEVTIMEDVLYVFSSWNRGPITFTKREDTLHYHDFEYAVGFFWINDSSILFGNDTLYKLNPSIVTYDEIDLTDSISRFNFYESFNERAHTTYISFGVFSETDEDDGIIDEEFKPIKFK